MRLSFPAGANCRARLRIGFEKRRIAAYGGGLLTDKNTLRGRRDWPIRTLAKCCGAGAEVEEFGQGRARA